MTQRFYFPSSRNHIFEQIITPIQTPHRIITSSELPCDVNTTQPPPHHSHIDALHRQNPSVIAGYGAQWQVTLLPALMERPQFVALWNRHTQQQNLATVLGIPLSHLPQPIRLPSVTGDPQRYNLAGYRYQNPTAHLPIPLKAPNGFNTHINISAAMLVAIHLLRIEPGHDVLDLWHSRYVQASKSIVLAQNLWPHLQPNHQPSFPPVRHGVLHLNDTPYVNPPSAGFPTAGCLADYMPQRFLTTFRLRDLEASYAGAIGFTSSLPKASCGYDKVVLDVDSAGEQVGPWRNDKGFYMTLLLVALMAVRPGGRVLYAAPSLARDDHDDIVDRALKKTEEQHIRGAQSWVAQLVRLSFDVRWELKRHWAEQTAQGWIMLPDHGGKETMGGGRWGPLYFSLLETREVPV